MSRKGKSLETESKLMVAWAGDGKRVTANVYRDLSGMTELLYNWILLLGA